MFYYQGPGGQTPTAERQTAGLHGGPAAGDRPDQRAGDGHRPLEQDGRDVRSVRWSSADDALAARTRAGPADNPADGDAGRVARGCGRCGNWRRRSAGREPSIDEQAALQQALAESVADWGPAAESGADQPLTAGEQADYLADLASDELAHRMRVRLARMALQLDPDCVEAYVQLALAAADPEGMLEYCRQAMAAGQRALTPGQIRSPGEGRAESQRESYLFAWRAMVSALAQLERFEEAAEQGLELLRTDRDDEANGRYVLLLCLLILDRDEQAEEVWRQFASDDHPVWLYARSC